MKFYVEDKYNYVYWDKIKDNKITAIYYNGFVVRFYKNGIWHNNKNAAVIHNNGIKFFYLNDSFYGNEYDFTKKSWRRFVKLKAFI